VRVLDEEDDDYEEEEDQQMYDNDDVFDATVHTREYIRSFVTPIVGDDKDITKLIVSLIQMCKPEPSKWRYMICKTYVAEKDNEELGE